MTASLTVCTRLRDGDGEAESVRAEQVGGRERQGGGDSGWGGVEEGATQRKERDGDRIKGGRTEVGRGAVPAAQRALRNNGAPFWALPRSPERVCAFPSATQHMGGPQPQHTQTSGLTSAESWLCLVLTLGCACWACR